MTFPTLPAFLAFLAIPTFLALPTFSYIYIPPPTAVMELICTRGLNGDWSR